MWSWGTAYYALINNFAICSLVRLWSQPHTQVSQFAPEGSDLQSKAKLATFILTSTTAGFTALAGVASRFVVPAEDAAGGKTPGSNGVMVPTGSTVVNIHSAVHNNAPDSQSREVVR